MARPWIGVWWLLAACAAPRGEPGQVDDDFGVDGVLTPRVTAYPVDGVEDAAVDSRGRILLGGNGLGAPQPTNREAWVARLRSDGTFDPGFGVDGRVLLGPGTNLRALVPRPDGGVIVLASGEDLSERGSVAIALEPDGGFDLQFGDDGVLALPTSPHTTRLAARDGRTVGWTRATGSGFDEGLVVLDADGLDGRFARRRTELTTLAELEVDGEGRVVAVGYADYPVTYSYHYGGEYGLVVQRLLPDGSLDPAFGSGGTVASDDYHYELEVAVDDAGGVIVLDSLFTGRSAYEMDPRIVRFDADGDPDLGFGRDGVQPVLRRGELGRASDLTWTADGGILVLAQVWDAAASESQGYVARFGADGSRDRTFGEHGRIPLEPLVRRLVYDRSGERVLVVANEPDEDHVLGLGGVVITRIWL